MESRNTTALFDKVNAIDNNVVTSEALFDTIDRDQNGNISKDEFVKMYDTVKAVVAKEHAADKEMKQKLQQTKRRTKVLCAALVFVVPCIAILLAGNMGLVYTLLEMSKETQVNGTEHAMRSVVDGGLIRVGEQQEASELTYDGALEEFDLIKTLVVNGVRATVLGSHVLHEDSASFYTSMGVFDVHKNDTIGFVASDPAVQLLKVSAVVARSPARSRALACRRGGVIATARLRCRNASESKAMRGERHVRVLERLDLVKGLPRPPALRGLPLGCNCMVQ